MDTIFDQNHLVQLMNFIALAALTFPTIDPIAFELGPIVVRWYGLAYMSGLLLGWYYLRLLILDDRLWVKGKAPVSAEQIDDLLLWITLGVIVGGRLGFVLLYEPGYFLANPSEILAVWHGGMAFHGGFLGVCLAVYLFARKYNVSFLSLGDIICAAAPFGLFFGRVANFINSEHFGHPTDVAWGMVFPNGGPDVRHPSQLYEALLEGLAVFLVIRFFTHTKFALKTPGKVIGIFLIGYGSARVFCEIFRVPESVHALNLGPLTTGQIYSIPMIIAGLFFLKLAKRDNKQTA